MIWLPVKARFLHGTSSSKGKANSGATWPVGRVASASPTQAYLDRVCRCVNNIIFLYINNLLLSLARLDACLRDALS